MARASTVYLALGANLGDRMENLRLAVRSLPPSVHPVRASYVYETLPWGYTDQPAFLNAVVEGSTRLKPGALMAYLKEIEVKLGRQPTFRNGPRPIDLDVLFYGEQIVELPGLEIPHPRLHERAFVLVPLSDLVPELVHPRLGCTVLELLRSLDQSGVQRYPGSLGI